MAPMSLPPGFKFYPTDEELVAYYLDRKINGRTIELEIIQRSPSTNVSHGNCLECFMDLTTSLLILITDVTG
ncbi:unnamed protein product [Malus baccata var. baccata]